MNICEHLTATARVVPDHVAIRFEGTSITCSQLDRRSVAAAEELRRAGISRGDRVALMLPNVPAFMVWYYGAVRVGAIAVSISTRAAPAEAAFLMEDSGSKFLVADTHTLSAVTDVVPDCVSKTVATSDPGDEWEGRTDVEGVAEWCDMQPHDPAAILYTSGTTGFAKGATLSHMNVRSNVAAFNHLCDMQPTDRILLAVPLFHCFGQNALMNSALNVGATLVLQRKFDLNETRRLIRDEGITQLYGVPMMFQLLMESCQPEDLSGVRYCFSAAATLPVQVGRDWQQKFGLPIHEGYGLTETSPFASYNHRVRFVPGTIGAPIDCVEMKIVDVETGEECPPGIPGEIIIRGPNVMLGYWNRESDTQDVIRDGWFHSGDIGTRDESGYFRIVDRLKDMIAVGGLKVFPAEVERVLMDHDDVAEAAVVGVPNSVFGEQVVAFVVLRSPGDDSRSVLAAIHDFASGQLANYKVPRLIVPINELPRNPSGKILKRKLREFDLRQLETHSRLSDTDENRAEGSATPATRLRDPVLKQMLAQAFPNDRERTATRFLQKLIQDIAGLEELPPAEAKFLDVGLDSLMIVELSNQIQVELGSDHAVPATLAFDHPRIIDLSRYLLEALMPADREAAAGASSDVQSAEQTARAVEAEIDSMSEEQALEELMKELDE